MNDAIDIDEPDDCLQYIKVNVLPAGLQLTLSECTFVCMCLSYFKACEKMCLRGFVERFV